MELDPKKPQEQQPQNDAQKTQEQQPEKKPETISYEEALKLADQKVSKALKTSEEKLREEFLKELKERETRIFELENAGKSEAERKALELEQAKKLFEQEKTKYEKMIMQSELEKQYATQGLKEEEYSPIVEAQLKGDNLAATKLLSTAIEILSNRKAEEKYKADVSSIKSPQNGKNTPPGDITPDKFKNLTLDERQALKEKDANLYKKLISQSKK